MDNQCDKCLRLFKTPESLKNHQAFHKRQEKGSILKIKLPIKRKIDLVNVEAQSDKDDWEPKRLVIDAGDQSEIINESKQDQKISDTNVQSPIQDHTEESTQDQASVISKPIPDPENELDTSATTHAPLPFSLSANLMQVFLSPVSLWLCPACISLSNKKDCWLFKNSGRTYITLSMCKQCVECNNEMQNLVIGKWKDFFKKKQAELMSKRQT